MIWVLGANGMLGRDLVATLNDAGHEVWATDIECDIRDPEALESALHKKGPVGSIVNCCAYTAVDQAEYEEAEAFALNADGPANLALLAHRAGVRLIHTSTDYVFDGSSDRPYTEDDPISPTGVYARSKAEGEARVRAYAPEAFVLRTAWLYGEHGRNFVLTMLRLMAEQTSISVVADQQGSPTWTQTVCGVIAELISRDVRGGGVYHVANQGHTSWYEFACAI